MINTVGTIKSEVLVRLSATSTSGYYSDAILDSWINDAHRFASSYKKWPFTEGRVSTTYASLVTDEDGMLVGEYPEGWKSDSIRQMKIGGKLVEKKEFYQFQKFLEDYPSDTDRIFSDYSRRYYINPSIDLSGTVSVWGQYLPAELDTSVPDTETIFSNTEDEGNQAIVELILYYAYNRERQLNDAELHYNKAISILEGILKKIQDEQYAYQLPDGDGMFERFDVVQGGFDDLKRDQF